MNVLHATKGSATGGRAGHAANEDGVLGVTLTAPKELGGDGKRGTNPEQLFACGYSACFRGALKFVAGKAGAKIPEDARVTATFGIGPRDDGKGFSIDAALAIAVPGIDRGRSKNWPRRGISSARTAKRRGAIWRGNLNVRLSVV